MLTINPAAMPPGTELIIGVVDPDGPLMATFSLVKDGTVLTCGPGIAGAAGSPSAPPPAVVNGTPSASPAG